MKKAALGAVIIAALAAALSFRLIDLGNRPMHHDEANQAVKFGALLEEGEYTYDKTDHHGPLLYYLTLPVAKTLGFARYMDLNETILRAVPAFFGAVLLLLFLFFGSSIDLEARAVTALLIAVSPAMTYYSRFYIQEMIFVFFVLGFLVSAWRYILRPDGGWYVLAGVFAGLMFATKETAVIIIAAAALGIAAVLVRERILAPSKDMPIKRKVFARHVIIALIAAAAVAAVFFSSFGSNPEGLKDAISSLDIYVEKGSDASGLHTHPFFYYLGLLAGRISGGLVWTEIFVLLLGLAGVIFIFIRRPNPDVYTPDRLPVDRSLGLFLVVYTVLTTLAFSLIPYKTPWNLLTFYLGWLILAGIGAIRIFRSAPNVILRVVVVLVLAAGLGHLALENRQANFKYPADPRNPYVYAQTSPDFLKLAARMEQLAAVHPEGRNLMVKILARPYEQWPLPWYLRKYKKVGYWQEADKAGNLARADVVIAGPDEEAFVQRALGGDRIVENYGLRPGVILTVHIDRKLWNEFMKGR
jgi:uncharacterized protein (TIGR03663 family)